MKETFSKFQMKNNESKKLSAVVVIAVILLSVFAVFLGDIPYTVKADKNEQLTTFSDGALTKKFSFGDIPPGNETAYIKLPEDADVINATMDAVGLAYKLRETLDGENAYDEFGFSVSNAGDVNNDGYDDVIVGAPYEDANGTDSGRVYIFHGMASDIASSPNMTLNGENAYDFFGVSVSCAGDVNNDGYDDIIIGANASDGGDPNPDYNCGRIYVYHGSENGITTPAVTIINGGWVGWEFGFSVSIAGDVNDDGYDDIIVGAPLSNFGSTDGGEIYIYHGSPSGISSQMKRRYWGTTGDHLGSSVSTAGDVNNDGYDDVIVGAYLADPGGGSNDRGKAYVFHGSSSGVVNTPSDTLEGEFNDDHFGRSVSNAGDVNSDGYDDVIVGADGAYKSGAGRPGKIYVFHGSSNGVYTTANTSIFGKKEGNHFGISVSNAGDVNNDGYDDIIAGAYRAYDPGGSGGRSGKIHIYHGTPNGIAIGPTPLLKGENRDDEFGFSVSCAGDVNNDGYDDVIIGAHHANASGEKSGKIYLHQGSASGIEDFPASFFDGEHRGDKLGCSVSTAGDVNNDGYDDVIVGAYKYTDFAGGKNESGAIYIFHGSASGTSTTPTTKIIGEGDYYNLGWSVSYAGDVNNDGYDDVVVGARCYDSCRGRVYVFYGSENGLNASSNTTIDGSDTNEHFGLSVSYAGDVNNDTFDDIIIGSNYSSPPKPDQGRIYVYHGSDSGISTTPATIIDGEEKYDRFGNSVSYAGDVDDDGFDDVVVGAYYHDFSKDSYDDGKIYVYGGGVDGIVTTPLNTVDGENLDNHFGYSVSYAGDVNSDGYDDIIVSAPRFDAGGIMYSGRVYIYHGSNSGIDIPAAKTIDGEEESERFGHTVSNAGNLNNDNYDDVIVGSSQFPPNQIGRISIYNGSSSGILTPASTVIRGEDERYQFGYSVSYAGDVNNDSYSDIIVGAIKAKEHGMMYVYYNSNEGILDWDSDYYPYNPRIDVGADGDYEWNYDGYFDSGEVGVNEVTNFSAELNDYLDNHQDEADEEGNVLVPINVTCDFRGTIELSNLDVSYIHLQPPTNLMAIIVGDDIELTWNASASPEVDYYNIYRSTNLFNFNYSTPFAQSTTTNWTDNGAVADTSTNYFYVVRTVNNRGNIESNTDKAGKFVKQLSEGKQLVSIPFVQLNTNITEVLKTIDGSYDLVQWFDPLSTEDNWMSYSSFKPQGLNDLLHINHTIAIWITMNSPDYLTIAGKVPNNTTIQLYEGWNFVGYPSLTNRTVGDALSDIWENVTQVEGFNDTNIPYYLETLSEDDMMIASHGYWICVTNDCVWMVEN